MICHMCSMEIGGWFAPDTNLARTGLRQRRSNSWVSRSDEQWRHLRSYLPTSTTVLDPDDVELKLHSPTCHPPLERYLERLGRERGGPVPPRSLAVLHDPALPRGERRRSPHGVAAHSDSLAGRTAMPRERQRSSPRPPRGAGSLPRCWTRTRPFPGCHRRCASAGTGRP